jgi:undecaprenyl phosphate-alpha-L-ara4N flippase subunit ArnE
MPRSDHQRAALQLVLVSVALNAVGQILFKTALRTQRDTSFLSIFLNLKTWSGFILYGLSAACWLCVLSRAQLSLAYPLLSLTFPIVVGLSALLFSEPVSLMHWVGVGVIVLGVSLLART